MWCDGGCVGCPFVGVCSYSGRFGCRVSGSALRGVDECLLCGFRFCFWDLSGGEVDSLVDWVGKAERRDVKSIVLPELVPIVSLRSGGLRGFLRDLGVDAVVVPFADLLDLGVFRLVVERGVHGFLGFDGIVVLSSIMPDELLVRDDVFRLFCWVAVACGFDAVVGWDAPVYVDMPLYWSWVNLVKGLELTYRLSYLDLPVIAMVKGNTSNQIRFSVDMLLRFGFRNFCVHASEYLGRLRFDGYARNVLYRFAGELAGRVESLLVVGGLRPSSLRFVREVFRCIEKLSVAGYSYYLDAVRHKLYVDDDAVDASCKYLACSCPSCVRFGSRRLAEDVHVRALHNFNQLKSMGERGFMHECSLYDLVIDWGEVALIASDVHGWTAESRLEEFARFILKVSPRHLILLGDVFDFRFGSPSISQLALLFDAVRRVKCSVHVVGGCCDGDLSGFLKALDELAYGQTHSSLIFAGEAQLEANRTANVLLDFYRLYRRAKEELLIRLPDGRVALALHGHKVVLNPKEKLDVVKSAMLEYKASSHVDWLIMGHVHRALIDYERGIALTGCWQIPPEHLKGAVKMEDLFKAILVDRDGSLKLVGESFGSV